MNVLEHVEKLADSKGARGNRQIGEVEGDKWV
jgi:hypothetical protein